jgi:hypothetical protein
MKSGHQEQLNAEVRQFQASAGVRTLLLATFLAVIYCVPVLQAAIEISQRGVPRFFEAFTRAPTRTNLRAYEKELDDSSFLAKSVRPLVQYAWHKVFGYAGEKVIVGREGWLFFRQDVDYLIGRTDSVAKTAAQHDAPAPEDPLVTIVDFRDQLARRGIQLMVMPVPGKPAIYPDKVTSRFTGSIESPTLRLISRLRNEGVEVIDLFGFLAQERGDKGARAPLYLKFDTHWSAEAARMVGEQVANRIHELGWLTPGNAKLAIAPVPVTRSGDLARMVPLPDVAESYPPEKIMGYQVQDMDSGAPYHDDPASQVLVLGDSFSRIYHTDAPRSAGFVAHLARGLHMPVASIINDGGASTLVRQELARKLGLLNGKKVVIWEFVERDISFGAEGWKKIDLGKERSNQIPR